MDVQMPGMIFDLIGGNMTGRIAMLRSEGECLATYLLKAGGGDHLEIGTLWGGSAILAARALMLGNLPGAVYTLDPMDTGYWSGGDPGVSGITPTEEILRRNIQLLGVGDRVEIIKSASYDWLPKRKKKFVTALIDGDHQYESVLRDFELTVPLVEKYILMHDFDGRHAVHRIHVVPACLKIIREHADDWAAIDLWGTLLVLERRDAKSVG